MPLLIPAKAFTLTEGTLPIIITLPHATPLGQSYARELQERHAGLKITEGGLLEIVEKFTRVCLAQKGRPYVLTAQVHRSRLDFSRSKQMVGGEWAYDDPRAEPLYDAFEATLAQITEHVTKNFPTALLLDLHGCWTPAQDIFIGTLNGKTTPTDPNIPSPRTHLYELLTARGWQVSPKLNEPEVAFMGRSDSIIARHNLAAMGRGNSASLQIEVSKRIRLRPSLIQKFAQDFAESILTMLGLDNA
jgi:hypothetical protein